MRRDIFKPDDDANCFLPRVEVRRDEIGDLALLFESLQQLRQAFFVLFTLNQVSRAFQVDDRWSCVFRQRALAVEVLDRLHEPVVLAALALNTPLQLRAEVFHVPSAEILIDIASGDLEVTLLHIMLKSENAVADQSRLGDDDGEDAVVAQPREVHVLKRIARAAGGNSDAYAARNQ